MEEETGLPIEENRACQSGRTRNSRVESTRRWIFLEGASPQPDGFLVKQHLLAVLLPEMLLGPSLPKSGGPPGSTPPSLWL